MQFLKFCLSFLFQVLMIVSFLEDEINQWRLRLNDDSYVTNRAPPSEKDWFHQAQMNNSDEWIHNIPNEEIVMADTATRTNTQ